MGCQKILTVNKLVVLARNKSFEMMTMNWSGKITRALFQTIIFLGSLFYLETLVRISSPFPIIQVVSEKFLKISFKRFQSEFLDASYPSKYLPEKYDQYCQYQLKNILFTNEFSFEIYSGNTEEVIFLKEFIQ